MPSLAEQLTAEDADLKAKEGTWREKASRASRAEAIINDPLVTEAFGAIDQELIKALDESALVAQNERERIYLMRRLLKAVRGQFEAHLRTGQIARHELGQINDRRGWIARRLKPRAV